MTFIFNMEDTDMHSNPVENTLSYDNNECRLHVKDDTVKKEAEDPFTGNLCVHAGMILSDSNSSGGEDESYGYINNMPLKIELKEAVKEELEYSGYIDTEEAIREAFNEDEVCRICGEKRNIRGILQHVQKSHQSELEYIEEIKKSSIDRAKLKQRQADQRRSLDEDWSKMKRLKQKAYYDRNRDSMKQKQKVYDQTRASVRQMQKTNDDPNYEIAKYDDEQHCDDIQPAEEMRCSSSLGVNFQSNEMEIDRSQSNNIGDIETTCKICGENRKISGLLQHIQKSHQGEHQYIEEIKKASAEWSKLKQKEAYGRRSIDREWSEMKRLKQKAYNDQNREIKRQKQKAYNDQNREIIRLKQRAYNYQNRELIRLKQKLYREGIRQRQQFSGEQNPVSEKQHEFVNQTDIKELKKPDMQSTEETKCSSGQNFNSHSEDMKLEIDSPQSFNSQSKVVKLEIDSPQSFNSQSKVVKLEISRPQSDGDMDDEMICKVCGEKRKFSGLLQHVQKSHQYELQYIEEIKKSSAELSKLKQKQAYVRRSVDTEWSEMKRLKQKAYNDHNREIIRLKQKAYNYQNREIIRLKQKLYRENIKQKQRCYDQQNCENYEKCEVVNQVSSESVDSSDS